MKLPTPSKAACFIAAALLSSAAISAGTITPTSKNTTPIGSTETITPTSKNTMSLVTPGAQVDIHHNLESISAHGGSPAVKGIGISAGNNKASAGVAIGDAGGGKVATGVTGSMKTSSGDRYSAAISGSGHGNSKVEGKLTTGDDSYGAAISDNGNGDTEVRVGFGTTF